MFLGEEFDDDGGVGVFGGVKHYALGGDIHGCECLLVDKQELAGNMLFAVLIRHHDIVHACGGASAVEIGAIPDHLSSVAVTLPYQFAEGVGDLAEGVFFQPANGHHAGIVVAHGIGVDEQFVLVLLESSDGIAPVADESFIGGKEHFAADVVNANVFDAVG